MKKISVVLDDTAETSLNKLLEMNGVSISDIVNAAVIAMAFEVQPVFPDKPGGLYETLKHKRDLGVWCTLRGINRRVRWALCERVDEGKAVRGLGDSNRWRDKQDERLYRTHTAWVAHCIREDFGIDIIS